MHLTSLYLLTAAWSAIAAASFNNTSGQGELVGMGVLLPRQQGRANLQTFSGALGGAAASAITNSGDPDRPFAVDGDTFVCRHCALLLLTTTITATATTTHPSPPGRCEVQLLNGSSTSQRDFETAANRACDNQKNVCADIANNGPGNLRVNDCDDQTGESVPLQADDISCMCVRTWDGG